MARQRRIEFADAIYHCMARGNRLEDIVFSDDDRDEFVRLLAELVARTGWEMFAWVLMSNHYHLVFKTPQPNLVEGMRWLQNTWTKRMNARHGLWGHLFGGRYKSVGVQENEHLAVLIDYVHLNPFRAGLTNIKGGVENYRWSSLGDYLLPVRKRSGWVKVEAGLGQRGYPSDRVAERRRYLSHLESIARDEGGVPIEPGGEVGTLQSTLRRGWYFGGEAFREGLLKRLSREEGSAKGSGKKKYRRESGYVGEQMRDHGLGEAERMLLVGLAMVELSVDDLKSLPKGDWRKRVIGHMIRRHTIARAVWISDKLFMGVSTRAARLISHPPVGRDWGLEWKEARRLLKRLVVDYEKAENLD